MIIYENSIQGFKKSILEKVLNIEIQGNLLDKFGIKVAKNEMRSWINSLPEVANLIKNFKNDKRRVLIEFNIPTSKQRIDFILLGKNKNNKPSAWLLELKQWTNVIEVEWNEFRIGRYIDSHPSDQAFSYMDRLNNEMGLLNDVDIKSGAFLHNLKSKNSPLYSNTYQKALNKAMLYSFKDRWTLAKKMENHTVIRDSKEALKFFKSATWKPTKYFMQQIEEDFNSLTLVGSQKLIYDKIVNFIKSYDYQKKITFIISGDPGSGKTIIAFKLLMMLLKELKFKLQLMIPGQELRKAFKHNMGNKKLVALISGSNMWLDYDAAIIDEAHKAISRDTGLINYSNIYKKMKFGIIFIDNDQVINRKGMEKEAIIQIAKKNGHKIYEYNIEENFRNRGERAILDWIDYVIYNKKTRSGEFNYSQIKYINKNFNYKLYSYKTAKEFVTTYFDYKSKDKNTRITSLWHKSFYIGPANKAGEIPKTIKIGNKKFQWNPNPEWWKKQSPNNKRTYNSFVTKYAQDRKLFLTGNPRPEYMAYFNHIQGYEFNNIFVYIPKVFTYENNQLIFHRDMLAKEVKISQTWSPHSQAKELNGKDPKILNKKYFLNRIKVMLTRGTKTTHIFAHDKNLNEYLNSSII